MPPKPAGGAKPKRAALPLQIPPRGINPAERRRQLNVDAQRRYRKRRREYVQSLEARLHPLDEPPTHDESTSPNLINGAVESEDTESAQVIDAIGGSATSDVWSLDNATTESIDPLYLQSSIDLGASFTPTSLLDLEYGLGNEEADVPSTLRPRSTVFASITQSKVNNSSRVMQERYDDLVTYTPGGNSLPGSLSTTNAPPTSQSAASSLTPPTVYSFADEANLAVFELSVLRGTKSIAQRLEIPLDVLWDLEAQSPFSNPANAHLSYAHLPLCLQPTHMQRRIPHHPMLDLLPWPQVRSKLLIMFCQPPEVRPPAARSETVLLDIINDADDGAEGMKVWGDDPFEPSNWEVGAKVWQRWWWAFDRETVRQSNRWRHSRGAPLLRPGMICSEAQGEGN